MKNVIGDIGCSNSQPTPNLGVLRQEILAELIGNPLFTKEEQLRANHHTHECECPQRLILWLRNIHREAERREWASKDLLSAAKRLAPYDAGAPMKELAQLVRCPALTAREKQTLPLLIPYLSGEMDVVSIVGRFYVYALRRSGKIGKE